MEELFSIILTSGEPLVMTKIIESSGSTPRRAGAAMLVAASGRIFGTIGGGAIEYEAEQRALQYLREKSGGIQSFRLTVEDAEGLGMVCGGEATVYFQYLPAQDVGVLLLAESALSKIKTGNPCWLITEVNSGKMSLSGGEDGGDLSPLTKSRPVFQAIGSRKYYAEPLVEPGTLYIFGGGHIAQALVPAAAAVGFKCVVMDDRPEFTKRELFPRAEKTILADFKSLSLLPRQPEGGIAITNYDYIAIMTRGHKHDTLVQAKALSTGARYIGVIGSRHKKAYVEAKLREQGFTDSQLKRIKTPIGIDIGAETPAEIAVSIVAELVAVRAGIHAEVSD